ncbi:MAG TPA: GMC oxidoreductase [Streptomyces sp.]
MLPSQGPQGRRADIAIIGHGIVGAVLARCLAESGARVLVVDGGSPLGTPAGTHLRNLPLGRDDRSAHFDLVRACLRPVSVHRAAGQPLGPDVPPMPEGRGINAEQVQRGNMPAARSTSVFGGMGTLWSGVAPRLVPEIEHWPGIEAQEWNQLYDRAEELLGVRADQGRGSARQEFVLDALAGLTGTVAHSAALAARRIPGRPAELAWTGPAEVVAEAGAQARERIRVLPQHAVRRLRHRGGRVLTAEALDLGTGREMSIKADTFLVAAGGIRTPALLWASGVGVGEESALGRYLTDHPLAYAQVVLSPRALSGDPAKDAADPYVVIPVSNQHPYHALLLCDGYDAAALEGRVDERLVLSLYWYCRMEPRRENRLLFRAGVSDAFGLPQPTFRYALGPEDRARRQAALAEVETAGGLLGTFLPGRGPQLLSAGASMHVMGTTRTGARDDGASVVDGHGRVWGFGNLYLGGTGLLPSPTATNPTLAACALAVRTASRIAAS